MHDTDRSSFPWVIEAALSLFFTLCSFSRFHMRPLVNGTDEVEEIDLILIVCDYVRA